MLDKDIEKILISRDEIKNRCVELGQELTAAYADKNPLRTLMRIESPHSGWLLQSLGMYCKTAVKHKTFLPQGKIEAGTSCCLINLL